MKSALPRNGGSRILRACAASAASAALLSCDLDTTSPNTHPPFAPVYRLVTIDGQNLPDTLSLSLENAPPNTPHKVETGALQFIETRTVRLLRWTMVLQRITDSLRFTFSFDASYVRFGADSLGFPTSRTIPAEFFGARRGDSLRIITYWDGDVTTPAALVGGAHVWRFVRDSAFSP
jgi:hypothetical protein